MADARSAPTRAWQEIRRLTALGEPLMELAPAEGAGIRVAFGGDIANSTVCLARILGASPVRLSLVTALGDSTYSAWLRAHLTREGIDVTEPAITGEPGIYGIPLDPERQAAFSYWRSESAARRFLQSLRRAQLESLLDGSDLLLVTGITLALCSDESFGELCTWVQRHRDSCRVVFDCNFRRALWPSLEHARARIGAFEPLASLVATGMEDERTLWGASGTQEIIQRLAPLAVEYLIRDGQRGCWVGCGAEAQHAEAVAATVVDTAGAGDAHLAGYLAARVSGCVRLTAAQYANRVAAVIVGQRGSAAAVGAPLPPLPAAARA